LNTNSVYIKFIGHNLKSRTIIIFVFPDLIYYQCLCKLFRYVFRLFVHQISITCGQWFRPKSQRKLLYDLKLLIVKSLRQTQLVYY